MSPAVNVEQLKAAKAAVQEVVKTNNCHPIMVRLAWHDSGSYCGQVWHEFAASSSHKRRIRRTRMCMKHRLMLLYTWVVC